MSSTYKTVYSTDRDISAVRKQSSETSNPAASAPKGPVRVSRETKGRKGAGVTIITGLPMSDDELKAFLSRCKKRLGCGGTLRNGALEFQGEHRDALLAELAAAGIPAKKSGS